MTVWRLSAFEKRTAVKVLLRRCHLRMIFTAWIFLSAAAEAETLSGLQTIWCVSSENIGRGCDSNEVQTLKGTYLRKKNPDV